MSDIKTPRFIELSEAISDAKEFLDRISPTYDYDKADRELIDARIDANMSNNAWDKMEKLIALKKKYPDSSGWYTINAQNLSDELSRFILVWESFAHDTVRSDRARYEGALKSASIKVSEAEIALADYLSSQDYRMDCLEAQVAQLSNSKKK